MKKFLYFVIIGVMAMVSFSYKKKNFDNLGISIGVEPPCESNIVYT